MSTWHLDRGRADADIAKGALRKPRGYSSQPGQGASGDAGRMRPNRRIVTAPGALLDDRVVLSRHLRRAEAGAGFALPPHARTAHDRPPRNPWT